MKYRYNSNGQNLTIRFIVCLIITILMICGAIVFTILYVKKIDILHVEHHPPYYLWSIPLIACLTVAFITGVFAVRYSKFYVKRQTEKSYKRSVRASIGANQESAEYDAAAEKEMKKKQRKADKHSKK